MGEAASRLVAFAGIPLAAMFLSDTELGALAIAMLAFSLLIIVFDFGIPAAATRLHFDDANGSGSRGLWWLMLSIVAGGFVLALAVGPLLVDAVFQEVPFYPLIFAVAIAAAGGALTAFGQARYRALFEYRAFAGLSAARSILLVVPGVVGAAVTGTAIGYVFGMAIGQLILGMVTIVMFRHEIGRPTTTAWRAGMLFGIPIVPHLLFGWWLTLADRVLLERWWGLAEVGVYALSYQLAFAAGVVVIALNNIWAPRVYQWFSSVGSEKSDTYVAWAVGPAMAVLVLTVAFTATVAPMIFGLIRPEIPAPDQVFRFVTLASLFSGLYVLGVSPAFARGESRVVPVVTGAGVVVNLIGNIVLIPSHAGAGAAFSTLLGYATTAAVMIVMGRTVGFAPLLLRRLAVAWGLLMLLSVAVAAIPRPAGVAVLWIVGIGGAISAAMLLRSDVSGSKRGS